jgi:predicted RND superfamily exporter protein
VVTLQRLLPKHQTTNLVLLREIFALLDDRAMRALPADLAALAHRVRDRTKLVPVGLDDLPPRLLRLFRERDGQTGRLVLVYPTLATNAQHGRLQLSFARTLREVVTKTDPTALVAGQLILSADIVESITRGGSLAAVLSFAAVGLLTLLILRSLRDAAWVLGSLCLGTLWMAAAFGALEVKLNFVNFVVLPITFGIGVDYAVNFYQRYRQAPGPDRAAQALAASGGAVALCSATTILGYSALLIADSRAIHSFGLTAVVGEITCLSAALFALPAILTWRERG